MSKTQAPKPYIYWFAYFNTNEPSVRYRATYPLEQLKETHEIDSVIVYPEYSLKAIFLFLRVYLEILFWRRPNSWVVYQKIHTNGIYTKALKVLLALQPTKTLYDIDDAEHLRQPIPNLHYFIRRCTACLVGSQALAAYIRPLNRQVHLLTSPVLQHPWVKKTRNEQFTIGWIGYYGAHRRNLRQLIFPALIALKRSIKLVILGVKSRAEVADIQAYFVAHPQVEVEAPMNLDWLDEAAVYQRIQQFDVGLAPLMDTAFNRAKSAFKLKQCLSCGVPVLGSPVGENKQFLEVGKQGYFCATKEAYQMQLEKIATANDATYQAWSEAARASLQGFNLEAYNTALLAVLTKETKDISNPSLSTH